MNPIASYTFLPWLRTGVANTITAADGDPAVATRATVHVELTLSGDPVGGGAELSAPFAQDVALYGPGDIVGIDTRSIVRTDPREWITNFEGNYLPAIDFYDEDFPWRYTPAAPDASGLKLRPWITLIVLAEGEFTDGNNLTGRPSAYISVDDPSRFPPADQLWAWAHVHVNELLSTGPDQLVVADTSAVVGDLQTALDANRDVAYSRLLCPRLLDDNTGYYAFVVPTFETGRLAGLGLDPAGAPNATASAWGAYSTRAEPTNYPIYHRWYFRTGSHGDFEYLVRLLKPQPVDSRVGSRDIDVQAPGSNITPITRPDLGGVLKLGGALQVPDVDLNAAELATRTRYDTWDQPYPDPFQTSLAAFVNLPDDYAAQTPGTANAASGLGAGVIDDPDPLITADLYGRWPSLTQRLLTERDGTPTPNAQNWVHRLNLDPRFRVPAAFGAQVVETNAESYLDDAWQQIGDVLAANARIRGLQLATGVANRWYSAHLQPLSVRAPERAFSLLGPVAGRVRLEAATLAYTQRASLLPPVYNSTALRRTVRPGARLMRSLPFDATRSPDNLLTRVNAGEVSAAPPKTTPAGVVTVDQVAAAAAPADVPSWAAALLKLTWLPWAAFVLAAIALIVGIVLLFIALVAGIVVLVVALFSAAFGLLLRRWQAEERPEQTIEESGQTPASVDALPKSPDFVLTAPGATPAVHAGATDSPTAQRFKAGLRDAYEVIGAARAADVYRPGVPLPFAQATSASVLAVDPKITIPKRGLTAIEIPAWIRAQLGERFDEVMAYPKIDLPMYAPLKAISVENFLPNINLIAPNSITLIETNQRFIEAYLVGLNHEFARKLLWRGYPTDQRGSYFRQFWDVNSFIDSEGLSTEPLKEKLYDIPELHRWSLTSALGEHNHRAAPGDNAAQAVLVIRGELLKKYPNAMIYAQRAVWPMKNGQIDLTVPRSLIELTSAEQITPPATKLRSPLYEAKADPDIYFFGFDLSIPEAKGGDGQHAGDDPGWFFVIKERPGEPRFGLETEREGRLDVFDELTWDDAIPSAHAGQFLTANSLGSVGLVPVSPPEPDRQAQHDDDEKVDAAAISSARWAYLLFRAPILVAVHADEMLGSGS